jgi:hypothetical protein
MPMKRDKTQKGNLAMLRTILTLTVLLQLGHTTAFADLTEISDSKLIRCGGLIKLHY